MKRCIDVVVSILLIAMLVCLRIYPRAHRNPTTGKEDTHD